METVIKRDKSVQAFDKTKIQNAIKAAFIAVDGYVNPQAYQIIYSITDHISQIKEQLTVENIQDLVEVGLMSSDRKDVAKAYIKYRFRREVLRKENTTDSSLIDLIDGRNDYWNNENSNKNSKIVTTQRDYLAGITSTDITRRFLLDEDIVKAHDEGIIHFHDCDYFAQNALHNCFIRSTRFYTKDGIKTFVDFNDGDIVYVPTHKGRIMKAQVHKYAPDAMYQIRFIRDKDLEAVYATGNHRWMLNDGTVKTTSELREEDKIFSSPLKEHENKGAWKVESVIRAFESTCWCLNVEEDHSFILEGGIVTMNCELINLDDMLQNGTVLNGVMIEKPHRLITAATVATQIILAVASSSYGGATITLTHLAPFVRDSKTKNINKYIKEGLTPEKAEELADKETRREIVDAVQTFNYQVNSMTSINGQAPFLSVCLYTNENPEYKKEVALLTEEFLLQRMQGFKNEKGVWITPAFPKLLYVLDEDNMKPDSEFYYLTKLAAQCTAKRMVPDYISAKMMRKLKINRFGVGDVYPCMGALTGNAKVTIMSNNDDSCECCKSQVTITHAESISFEELWNDITKTETPKQQKEGIVDNLYFDEDVMKRYKVLDSMKGFIGIKKFMRNTTSKWVTIKGRIDPRKKIFLEMYDNPMVIECTYDHPFPTENRGRVEAECLVKGDVLTHSSGQFIVEEVTPKQEKKFSYDFETETDHFQFDDIYSYNCRSFLTPWRSSGNISRAKNFEADRGKYYGRFNQGVVTLNLPDVAFSSGRDMDKFWKILDERCELCHRALQTRTKRLASGVSDMAPILWQYGALARLGKKESIEPLLHEGYSTISLGYAGLYECVKCMLGVSHTTPKGEDFGMKVMQFLNDKCKKWREVEDIDYSVYGTPIESATYKFAKCLKKRFGNDIFLEIDGKDRNYITNSYHVPVFEKIDPFEKLAIESKFQILSPGGAISYIECASLIHNPDAVLEVIKFIYDNIMYAELNIKSDYCQACGYEGEIKIIDEGGKLDWKCPQCGNKDHDKMNIARRTCGYIGVNFFNQGRTDEIRNRFVHLDDQPILDACQMSEKQ